MRTASRNDAGIFMAASGLVRAQSERSDVVPAVFAATDENTADDRAAWGRAEVETMPSLPPAAFSFTPGLGRKLEAFRPDVVHLHGLWLYNSILARHLSHRLKSRTLISIHGMMTPWAMQRSRLRKRIALALYERSNLEAAHCLHALTPGEAEQARGLGLTGPICVIPNGIDLQHAEPKPSKPGHEARELLFLGRLHPVKGIDDLLRGWAAFRSQYEVLAKGWRLNIAGWGDAEYRAELERLVRELGVGDSVVFSGAKHGDALWRTYAAADAFILTSRSEAMPMTILEAWAAGLPVVMTPECGLSDGQQQGAALSTARQPAAIGAAIAAIAGKSDAERSAMGRAGRALVEQRYAWPRVAEQFAQVYRWLARGGARPGWVVTSTAEANRSDVRAVVNRTRSPSDTR